MDSKKIVNPMRKRKLPAYHLLISAGPTLEPIDPVRYISNHSSGKMGYALAKAALDMGWRVTLVTGPVALVPPQGCLVIHVETAKQMERAMLAAYRTANITISVAAVADYRPAQTSRRKIKKTRDHFTLRLVKNPDILEKLGRLKKAEQILVGFAAETHSVLKYGREKLVRKNLDWIVVNNVAKKGIGFGTDDNAVVMINGNGDTITLPRQKKISLAKKILQQILTQTASANKASATLRI